ALTSSRRSTATGWRRAIVSTALFSILRCIESIAGSRTIWPLARSRSQSVNALLAALTDWRTKAPISRTSDRSPDKSASNTVLVWLDIAPDAGSGVAAQERYFEPASDGSSKICGETAFGFARRRTRPQNAEAVFEPV